MRHDLHYTLGLDLGTNSIGWALIETRQGRPAGALETGVRIFPAGLDGDIESGTAEPRNAARRAARQLRRQADRRRRRKRKVFHLLQARGLLPRGEVTKVVPELDRELTRKMLDTLKDPSDARRLAHVMPYWLRARALSEPLGPFELGRALYHLAQRRGFLSNRKADAQDADAGQVRQAISELEQEMKRSGAATLGAYFVSLDPERVRIRNRWTARWMYEEEFDRIWTAQQQYHSSLLTPTFREKVRHAIFHQRPLKSVKDLIGPCAFEPGKRRAPWAILDAQEFRILQKILDTRVVDHETGELRALSDQERRKLMEGLETTESLTFARAKKQLNLKNCTFNWEEGGEKKFVGNRTGARVHSIIGDRWLEMNREQRDALVEDLLSIQREEALVRRARQHWGFDREQSEELAGLLLEQGYCQLSRKALRRFLPRLRDGTPYSTAAQELYPGRRTKDLPLNSLPMVQEALPQLRNPVVIRVLTELRKVVNGILREYGRPTTVRIELARDLKSSRKEKTRRIQRNRTNEKKREAARKKILEEAGIQEPSRHDVLKVQLAEECGWICPYTGKQISMETLVGPESQFDVEHIIPFSRCFDNSFANKTLCYAPENRTRKGNRTPAEAYISEPERYGQILSRVSRFQGPLRAAKLRRFQTTGEDEIESYRCSQLNDTRYASILAVEYIAKLFGGVDDHAGKKRVFATRGGVTALLRNAWDLNSLLSDGERKTRDDHRHHAVDAVVIALSTPAVIESISHLATRRGPGQRIVLSGLADPWPGFLDEVRSKIGQIKVSHRPRRKVSGALHEETLYSPPKLHPDGRTYVHVRKPVHGIGGGVDHIVDPVVREAVKKKLKEVGEDPKKLQGEGNLPHVTTGDGRTVPIRRVRIAIPKTAATIGTGPATRHVLPGANHHLEIFAVTDGTGRDRWIGRMVTLLEAADRVRRHRPVVDRHPPDGGSFVFSLAQNDIVEISENPQRAGLWRMQKMSLSSRGEISIIMQRINDARQVSKIGEAGRKWSLNTLRKDGARKVTISPIGKLTSNRE